jgi:plastocyanin
MMKRSLLARTLAFLGLSHVQAAPVMLVIRDTDFSPMTLTVPVGTTVTWRNIDDAPHTVTSTDGLFRSKALSENGTFSFKFSKQGTFEYVCSIDPKMVATIVVK